MAYSVRVDKEKADCLNDYFTSVSRVCDENTRLPNFEKLTNSNLDAIETKS